MVDIVGYMTRYKEWLLSDYFDEETKEELKAIEDDEKEIEERFYRDLEFGTGGMRGIIGAGTNRINKYIVQKVTQGMANYIINYSDDGRERGVVIAYDCRHKSPEFAREAALVLAGNDIKTYLFDELKPTPELSFAVRELNAVGGIVITASHNPPEYNGYKIYWEDGGQVVPEQGREIVAEINEVDDFELVKILDEEEARERGLLNIIGKNVDDRYTEELLKVLPDKELVEEKGDELKLVYTPLHGTANKPVRRVLQELGFENLQVVPEQVEPDPEFSTVESPNPEDISAFELALEKAEEDEEKPDIIIATDPDGDRMGAVVKDDNDEYTGLTGNEMGVLFTDYLLGKMDDKGTLTDKGTIIKTIVTTEMVRRIAEDYNVRVFDVLTGFKYIGEKIKEFKEEDSGEFIFGFEESYGYLAGTYARDKDAVVASALAAVMALFYKDKGKSVYERLIELREKYGYYQEDLVSVRLEGKEGQEKIENTLAVLREEEAEEVCGLSIEVFKDYEESKSINLKDKSTAEIGLPQSNVLQYYLEDDSKITVRPSGTEPKLKIYVAVRGESDQAAHEKLESLKSGFMKKINRILEEE